MRIVLAFSLLAVLVILTLTNQQPYHRNCGGCHDEIVKNRKDVNPPTSKKCCGLPQEDGVKGFAGSRLVA